MGVSNVNNTNNIKALLLKKTSTASREARKPEYLKMTGSIFNAPETKETNNPTRASITELNTQKSLVQMKSTGSSKSILNPDKFEDIDNAADGKKAISTGNSAKANMESQIRRTENDQRTVKNLSNEAQKLGKDIIKNDKSFVQKLKVDQQAFKKDNEKIKKLNKETEETQKEIDNAQHELDSLMATNSFKISSGDGSNSSNQDRIKELQGFIGSKVVLLQNNGKAIYSLQRSQSKTISRMNKTNKAYINTQKSNKKNIKSQESANNKVIDVANKIEQYSAIVQTGGKAINMAGVALVALGQGLMATLFGSAAGAAMVSVGTVMQKVGHVVELVGQYGQVAANVTKTAAYAADGNILGAMQSCAMAVQSGAAAVKSTQNLGNSFKEINAQATEAQQNIASKAAAKEAVNNMSEEQLKEMGGKKAARQFITADLREQMQENKVNKFSDMKEYVAQNGKDANSHIEAAKEKAAKAYSEATTAAREGLNLGETGNTYTNKKGKVKYVSDNKIAKKANKIFRNEINDKKANLSNSSPSMGTMIKDFGSSMTNIGTIFMQNKAMGEVSKQMKKSLPTYQMNARTRSIMERNQRYTRHARYV